MSKKKGERFRPELFVFEAYEVVRQQQCGKQGGGFTVAARINDCRGRNNSGDADVKGSYD